MKLEKQFCNSYKKIPEQLKLQYDSLLELENITLDTMVFSKAILTRLISYYSFQNDIKLFLGKKCIASGADFFVETILFYLKFILSKFAPELEVISGKID